MKERGVTAYGAFFSNLGGLLHQWIVPVAGIAFWGSIIFGIQTISWIIGIFIMAGIGVLTAIFTKERLHNTVLQQEKVSILESMKAAFSNRNFLIIVSIMILNTSNAIVAGLDHYILIYYMADGDILLGSVWKGLLTTGYVVVSFLIIPVTVFLSKKIDKRETLMIFYLFMLIGGAMKWFIFKPGHVIYNIDLVIFSLAMDPIILLDPILCAPMWGAVRVIFVSMLADICDEDELKSGKRREGMFSATFSWIEKLVYSLSLLGIGMAIQISGFDNNLGGNQSHETLQ